jgi:hypothetical protein
MRLVVHPFGAYADGARDGGESVACVADDSRRPPAKVE